MSLRLRLTIFYLSLLSGIVLLLSLIMYVMINIVILNQIQSILEDSADSIRDVLWIDVDDMIGMDPEPVDIYGSTAYQVWSSQADLLFYSDPENPLNEVMVANEISQAESDFRKVTVKETTFRVLSLPLEANGNLYGWLQIEFPMTQIEQSLRSLRIVFGVVTILAVLISGSVAWFVIGKGLQPLETMVKIAKGISNTDDLSLRLPVDSNRVDEISQLGLTFNKTLIRLERLFNTQRQFLADVSHELRTPLTVIKANVGLMQMMQRFDAESLDSIDAEVDRLTRLVGDLLLVSQAEIGKLPLLMASVELDDLIFEVFEQMKVLSDGGHDIHIVDIEPVMVTGDRDRLKQVFLNLGTNAIKYTPQGKKIHLSLSVRDKWVVVKMSDEGFGVPKAEVGRLFERFYRGDKSRKRIDKTGGFGLGLPIAYWIVRNHGGKIEVKTEVDVGTTFSVWLPISQADVPTRPLQLADEGALGEKTS